MTEGGYIKDADLFALTEAVLDGKEPNWAEVVRQIRNENGCGLREGVMMARYALKTLAGRDYPNARILLERMP